MECKFYNLQNDVDLGKPRVEAIIQKQKPFLY